MLYNVVLAEEKNGTNRILPCFCFFLLLIFQNWVKKKKTRWLLLSSECRVFFFVFKKGKYVSAVWKCFVYNHNKRGRTVHESEIEIQIISVDPTTPNSNPFEEHNENVFSPSCARIWKQFSGRGVNYILFMRPNTFEVSSFSDFIHLWETFLSLFFHVTGASIRPENHEKPKTGWDTDSWSLLRRVSLCQ